jgi:hypothetical protein
VEEGSSMDPGRNALEGSVDVDLSDIGRCEDHRWRIERSGASRLCRKTFAGEA